MPNIDTGDIRTRTPPPPACSDCGRPCAEQYWIPGAGGKVVVLCQACVDKVLGGPPVTPSSP